MTPDSSFVRDLTAYDAKLRVRFGTHTRLWIIERKMEVRNPAWLAERPLNPFGRGARAKDLWAGWREGYVHVLSVHPNVLYWSQVAPELARTDRQLAGSWQALSDQIDAADAKMDAERDREVANWSEAASKDAADYIFWQEGHTVATPMSERIAPDYELLEEHDGFVVRVRRRAVSGGQAAEHSHQPQPESTGVSRPTPVATHGAISDGSHCA